MEACLQYPAAGVEPYEEPGQIGIEGDRYYFYVQRVTAKPKHVGEGFPHEWSMNRGPTLEGLCVLQAEDLNSRINNPAYQTLFLGLPVKNNIRGRS